MLPKLLKLSKKLSLFIASTVGKYKKAYQKYKKDHPSSKMSFKKFSKARGRDSVFVGHAKKGDPIHHKKGIRDLTKKALSHHLKKGSFSMMSAENPTGKKKLSDKENKSRTKKLHKKLKDMGAVFHKVKGHYSGEENSVMVHHSNNVTPEALEELANGHDQESILHSTGGHHKLHHLRDDSQHMYGEGHTIDDNLDDFYSKIQGTNDKVRLHVSSETSKKDLYKSHCYTVNHPNGEKSHIKLHLNN